MDKKLTQNISQSVIAIILFNLYPIYGVLFLDWNVGKLLLLYWLESLIIAFFTVVKVFYSKNWSTSDSWKGLLGVANILGIRKSQENLQIPFILKIFTSFIFFVSYLLTAFFHFYIITLLIIAASENSQEISKMYEFGNWISTVSSSLKELLIPLIFILIGHVFSFIKIYLGEKEYEKYGIWEVVRGFWPRNYTVQLTLILGTLLIIFFSNIDLMIIALVVAKIVVDIRQHNLNHKSAKNNSEIKIN